jgi:NAD(P)-dependent dehydrogenase (short-subunit alcohol dehydrogenase family)
MRWRHERGRSILAGMTNHTLQGTRIVVLGGSAGIGLAVAERALGEGAEVIIASHDRGRVERAVARLRRSVRETSAGGVAGHAVDLRSAPETGKLFEAIGSIDHLVYTAGEELLLTRLAELDLAAARRFFELRYWGALAAVQAARPHLAREGSIVLTSGAAGRRPHPGFVIGAGICAAMEATARALAVELAPVRVNVVVPGFVDTELWSNIPEQARAQMFRDAAAKLPVGRIGTPDDIAEHYLSFMRGRYVTGQAVVVDGGGVLV